MTLKNTTKYIALLSVLCLSLSTLFAFDAHRVTPVDVRSAAMGGTHLADTESFYGMYENPASITFTENKKLILGSSTIFSGPFNELFAMAPDAYTTLTTEYQDDEEGTTALTENVLNPLLSLIGENGLNLGLNTSNLTFGRAIKIGSSTLAWGTMDNLYFDASLASATKGEFDVGIDTGLEVAYAMPIELGAFGILSVGASGRGTYQIESGADFSPMDFLSSDEASPLDSLAVYETIGFGIDAGIQHQIGIVSTALVAKDIYSPVWTTEYSDLNNFVTDYTSRSGTALEVDTLDTQLAIGTEVILPLNKLTLNIISDSRLYADYADLIPLFASDDSTVSRNPILDLSFGTEIELLKVLNLRLGLYEWYPTAGASLELGGVKINGSVYGSEEGLQPGSNPQLNAAFSFLITY